MVARPCRAGREGVALDRVSPALRAWASDFSLRCQRKVTKRKATPANPLASPVPSVLESTSDGPPQTAHPCAGCGYAIIPDGVPDVASGPRQIGGGATVSTHLLKFGYVE